MMGIKVKTSKYDVENYIGEIVNATVVSEPFVLNGYGYVYVKFDNDNRFHTRKVSTNLIFSE